MPEIFSDIIYFCPQLTTSTAANNINQSNELNSILKVADVLREKANINVTIASNWPSLIELMQDKNRSNILIVFRLDFLERENMVLSEILTMLSSLSRFVSEKVINIAVVVPGPCDADLILQLKRNGVLGIVPGMRFFEHEHAIEAYERLRRGQSHWPAVAIAVRKKQYTRKKRAAELTKRQHEIFVLIAKRGLSNAKIADTLKISECTVKIHVSAILRRYGVKNRTQLALADTTST